MKIKISTSIIGNLKSAVDKGIMKLAIGRNNIYHIRIPKVKE